MDKEVEREEHRTCVRAYEGHNNIIGIGLGQDT